MEELDKQQENAAVPALWKGFMRSIGRLPDEAQGKRFGDFLYGEGIESQVDQSLQGDWEVWVLDDENIETAQALFHEFVEHPDDPRFTKAPGPSPRRDGRTSRPRWASAPA